MFLLKIFLNLWPAGKHLPIRLINALPMFVLTFLLNGGLNHITFLCLLRFCGLRNKFVLKSICAQKLSSSSSDLTCSFTVEHYLGLTGEHHLYYIYIYIYI